MEGRRPVFIIHQSNIQMVHIRQNTQANREKTYQPKSLHGSFHSSAYNQISEICVTFFQDPAL
jgi:hypothetical protein